nr:hypothetical protein Q903MT_gene5044 [Picea sitchensis]
MRPPFGQSSCHIFYQVPLDSSRKKMGRFFFQLVLGAKVTSTSSILPPSDPRFALLPPSPSNIFRSGLATFFPGD